MNVSIGARWENFIEQAISEGRYASASEIMREGLRLVEEREARLNDLRKTINEAIELGGSYSLDEVKASIAKKRQELIAEGIPA